MEETPTAEITPDEDLPSRYKELATQLMHAIDAIGAQIPGFEAPHSSTVRFVRSHRTVPRAFIATMASVVSTDEELLTIGKFDPDAAQDALEFTAAFRPFARKVSNFLKTVFFTIEKRHADAAAGALQMYQLAKALARHRDGRRIGITLETLRRDLKRGKRKKKAKEGE